jgi:hypothetical protein
MTNTNNNSGGRFRLDLTTIKDMEKEVRRLKRRLSTNMNLKHEYYVGHGGDFTKQDALSWLGKSYTILNDEYEMDMAPVYQAFWPEAASRKSVFCMSTSRGKLGWDMQVEVIARLQKRINGRRLTRKD